MRATKREEEKKRKTEVERRAFVPVAQSRSRAAITTSMSFMTTKGNYYLEDGFSAEYGR